MPMHPNNYPVKPRVYTRTQKYGHDVYAAMMPYPMTDPSEAGCYGNPEFTSDERMDTLAPRLRPTCEACPFRVACAEWGIAHEEFGYWGATTPDERKAIRKRRGQALVEPFSAFQYGLREDYVNVKNEWKKGKAFNQPDPVEIPWDQLEYPDA